MSKDPLRTYAMMAKPVSSACNLRCGYCYYADKEKALNVGRSHMSDAVLEAFIVQNLAMHGSSATVEFAWHGGEPALAGVGFYEKVVELQQKHGEGRQILNSIQTNATLLTDEFCSFFKDNTSSCCACCNSCSIKFISNNLTFISI